MTIRILVAALLVSPILSGEVAGQFLPSDRPRPALAPTGEPFRLLKPTPPAPEPEIVQASFRTAGTPLRPGEPRPLPAAMSPTPPARPEHILEPREDVGLPQPERKFAMDSTTLTLKRFRESWQIWVGQTQHRNFGNAEREAVEALRVMRDLKVNEWVTIGSPVPLLEYGLQNGRATAAAGLARFSLPIDLRTVKAEYIKGVWVLRDAETLFLNFGTNRADAEQAAAVVQKYGFDRIGFVGQPTPAMSYLFVGQSGEQPVKHGLGEIGRQAQVDALARTGIPVPGLGFVGEMVRIDYRKVEVRRDGSEWVLAHGPDVLGRFGAGEWQARDALRVVQDGHFTEWCRFGNPGVTFFLTGGKAPSRVPFATVTRQFSESDLHVKLITDRWYIAASGRPLFEVASSAEGENLVLILRHFGFNQTCQSGNSARASLTFLAKGR